MVKHEWRKKEKKTYLPKNKPEIIDLPTYKFLVLSGEGNPNKEPFLQCIGALYSLCYAIKMTLKKIEKKPKGYMDYTVYPLEGVWDLNEEAKKNFTGKINKEDFVFDLMIRQPDFVEERFFQEMLELTKKKKPHPLLDEVRFMEIKEGKCIQMMHIGPYDDEPASFKIMETFAEANNLIRTSKVHREIYI